MVDRYAQQLARGVGGDSPSPREVRQ
jgi:hypothetical protein